MISITWIIIGITVAVSFIGFSKQEVVDKLIFYPPAVADNTEYYRFISCGFIHADLPHLIFNMYALYLFGEGMQKEGVEFLFGDIFGNNGKMLYLVMYVLALAVCLIPTFNKHKANYYYRSLGASGAVSAVVFAYILLDPMRGVGLIFIPVFIPGFLFGIIYLVVSYFLGKKGKGHINHSAHIWGALFGIVFLIICSKLFTTYPVLENFINAVKNTDYHRIFTTN